MSELRDLDATATAAALEAGVAARRRAEVDDLRLVLHWADLHASEPYDDPRLDRVPGGERLVDLGGEGTPSVRELALVELGVARCVHTVAARAVTADVLDLRHRLPRTWAVVRSLTAEPWVARRVASMSRQLPLDRVGVVDAAVAAVIGTHAPSRVLDVAEAAVIEADTAAHDERVAREMEQRFVALTRRTPQGMQTLVARGPAGDVVAVRDVVDRLADAIAPRPELAGLTRHQLRAEAFAILARPDVAAALLAPARDDAATPATPPVRGAAVVYVHLAEEAGLAMHGVARVEGLGPHSLTQLRRLLGGREVVVKPVVDLREQRSTTAYEHPTSIRETLHLRHPVDCFPHASLVSGTTARRGPNLDLDHLIPYEPGAPPGRGPRGQTSTEGSRPIGRTAHRAKTHLGYRAVPIEIGGRLTGEVYWLTPHGRHRIVDHHGTHVIDDVEAAAWTSPGQGEKLLARLLLRIRHERRTAA